MTDERGLIGRAGEGDERAFRELYDRHVDGLFRFLRQYSDDTFLVEDWVQRAFIHAFHGIGEFRSASKFSTWLFTIGLNEMRSDARRKNIVAFDSRELDSWDGREEDQADFLWVDAMKGFMGQLDDTKRSVFLLYEVEGYTHGEIAGMLGVTEGTSRALLCRAKQILRSKVPLQEKIA